MKLSQVRVKDLVVGTRIIAAEGPAEERFYLDELELWKITLITKRSDTLWELHLVRMDDIARKHTLVCFGNETVPVMVGK